MAIDDIFKEMPADKRRSVIRCIMAEGMVSRASEAISNSVFLISLALWLGASNSLIGLLGAIPFLSNIFQLVGVVVVQRLHDRRLIVLVSGFVGRMFLILVVIAPFFAHEKFAIWLVILGIALRYSMGAISACAFNSWSRDLIPMRSLGKFHGRRLTFFIIVAAAVGAIGAEIMERWPAELVENTGFTSYSFLFLIAMFLGVISMILIRKIPHPDLAEDEKNNYKNSFDRHVFVKPFLNKHYRNLLFSLGSWNFAINIATPFFSVYMLSYLGYDTRIVVFMNICSQISNMFFLRIWGKMADQIGHNRILQIAAPLFVMCLLGWVLLSALSKNYDVRAYLLLLHIVMGCATAGMLLGSTTLSFALAPDKSATSFLAMYSIVSSLFSGMAPLFGGYFSEFLQHNLHHSSFAFAGFKANEFGFWSVFFAASFLFAFIAMCFVMRLGEAEENSQKRLIQREIVSDAGKILRTISSIAGLREIIMTPMSLAIGLAKNKRHSFPQREKLRKDCAYEAGK
jgi:MFS family permease